MCLVFLALLGISRFRVWVLTVWVMKVRFAMEEKAKECGGTQRSGAV